MYIDTKYAFNIQVLESLVILFMNPYLSGLVQGIKNI